MGPLPHAHTSIASPVCPADAFPPELDSCWHSGGGGHSVRRRGGSCGGVRVWRLRSEVVVEVSRVLLLTACGDEQDEYACIVMEQEPWPAAGQLWGQ